MKAPKPPVPLPTEIYGIIEDYTPEKPEDAYPCFWPKLEDIDDSSHGQAVGVYKLVSIKTFRVRKASTQKRLV